jgi:peptide-methionine (R)-S-oxide reductase
MADKVEKTEEEWRERLTPEQYWVARHAGTEPAFSGTYWNSKEAGHYACVCCGQNLFGSAEKYDSGSGWPSFWRPIDKKRVEVRSETTHGMSRTEVICSSCDAHLGHVFEDGPEPSGLRYCINSTSLKLNEEGANHELEQERSTS